jgi:hypothetical protein
MACICSIPEDGYIVAETCSDSNYRNFVYTLLHVDGVTQFVATGRVFSGIQRSADLDSN